MKHLIERREIQGKPHLIEGQEAQKGFKGNQGQGGEFIIVLFLG
jgi:hypothetical protein